MDGSVTVSDENSGSSWTSSVDKNTLPSKPYIPDEVLIHLCIDHQRIEDLFQLNGMAEIIISFSYQLLLPLLHLHQIYRSPSRFPLLCKPSSCRGLLIQYPFCLSGDPARCGDPNYQLTCCSNRILMEFLSDQFSVNKINYADSMMDAIEVGLLRNSLQCSHQIIACNFCFYLQILSVKTLVLDLLNDLFKKANYKGALVNSLFELERFICL